MYIKRISSWGNNEWNTYFRRFELVNDESSRIMIKKILCGGKDYIESNFIILETYGIINGIGPGYLSSYFRKILSKAFKGVKYEWHDIEFGIDGTFFDYMKANYGLLKYSLISLRKKMFNFNLLQIILQFIIIIFCFIMVTLLGFFSFNFIKR